jgi:hypothetical protein
MPKLRLVKKLEAVAGGSTLEMSVTKKLGPVATHAEVGSSGSDDGSFSDSQLTPGPAVMPINPENTYTVAWEGAFVKEGSVTLRVRVLGANENVLASKSVTVQGKAKEVFFRAILVP